MSRPRTPGHLRAPGRRLWRKVLDMYVLQPHHLEELAIACAALDRAESCRQQIDEHGELIVDRFGQLKANPLLPAERDARNMFLRGMQRLGLDLETPPEI